MFWESYGEFCPCTVKVTCAILKLHLCSEIFRNFVISHNFLIWLEKQHLRYSLEVPLELKNGTNIGFKWASHTHNPMGFYQPLSGHTFVIC